MIHTLAPYGDHLSILLRITPTTQHTLWPNFRLVILKEVMYIITTVL